VRDREPRPFAGLAISFEGESGDGDQEWRGPGAKGLKRRRSWTEGSTRLVGKPRQRGVPGTRGGVDRGNVTPRERETTAPA
jgi:hypothetical protein